MATDEITAICCSGGGIRSASFNLGALQEMAGRRLLSSAEFLIGVSGGGYMAASRSLAVAKRPAGVSAEDVYRPGSPEEDHLRDHTRYIAPDASVALRGVLFLVLGLAFNLALLLAWVFLLGHLFGWLFQVFKLVEGRPPKLHSSVRASWIAPAALAALGLALFAGPGDPTRKARRAGVAFSLATAVALVFIGGPWMVAWLHNASLSYHTSNLAKVLRWVGFATGKGTPGPTLAAAFTALVALVRGALGRISGTTTAKRKSGSNGSDGSAPPASPPTPAFVAKAKTGAIRVALAWLGSAVIVALLTVAWLRWASDGSVSDWRAVDIWLIVGVLAFASAGRLVTDVNRTSMHRFYTERLASAYAVARGGDDPSRPGPLHTVSQANARISDLAAAHLRPELVLCATANISAEGDVPPGRGATSFTFTAEEVALSGQAPPGTRPEQSAVSGRTKVAAPADIFERAVAPAHPWTKHVDFGLFDAVAICGAAVAPMMGKMTNRANRILFTVANVRLGVWLPHPRIVAQAASPPAEFSWRQKLLCWVIRRRLAEDHEVSWSRSALNELLWRTAQPNVPLLLAEAFRRDRVSDTWLYVSDGGHFDNLGLVEAFRRGATTVYVFDASGDKVTTWTTLGQAIALARSETGVAVDVDPTTMLEDGKVVSPWAKGSFTYTWDDSPQPRTGTIYICKLGVWSGAPWDVQGYAARHPSFPTDSTIQQLYNDDEFEAYRALGQAAAKAMFDANHRPAFEATETISLTAVGDGIVIDDKITVTDESGQVTTQEEVLTLKPDGPVLPD